jgi:LysR family transcriptional regulator, nitrogen assimilation regulatory protein
MDLKQLHYFVHVAELGSFSRAATVLSIAQPALSRQVRLLEVELRQTLLYRNGRGVNPTEAGKRLLAHSRGILEQVGRARQDLEQVKDDPVGHLVIGLPQPVGRVLTPLLVCEFRRRFPKGTLGVIEGLSTYILEWITMGRVDIGLVYDSVAAPGYEAEALLEERLYLITAPDRQRPGERAKTVNLVDLPKYPLIIPSRPHGVRVHVEQELARIGCKMNIAWEIDGISAVLDLVYAGHGHAIMAPHSLRGSPIPRDFWVRKVVRPELPSTLSLATPSQRPLTLLARRTVDLLRELIPARLQASADEPARPIEVPPRTTRRAA